MEATLSEPRLLAEPTDLDALAGSLAGRLIRPGDDDYDETRQVHQAAVDAFPLAIVRPADSRDVARAILFARDNDLDLAVRSGGHSVAGHGTVDGGIVLDMRDMRGLHIDTEARLAWVQPGITAGEYTDAAGAYGLATPFGDSGSVGIAGLTLGGGVGWLVRKHGLAIDALRAVEIVTADGRILTASEDEHPDLFWAVRGGGGNFGVVTRFQFRLYPVGMVLGGALVMPATADVLRALVPIAARAPTELSTISFFMAATPPLPFLAPEHHGKPSIVIMFVHSGDPEAGRQAIAPFRAVATPLGELVAPMPYPAIYQFTAEASRRHPNVTRSTFLETLDDTTVEAILARMAAAPSPMTFTQVRVLGGAMADIAPDATAFAHRDRPVMLTIVADAEANPAATVTWAEGYLREVAPAGAGVYANFLAEEGQARIRDAYPPATYERLADVKRRYDPANVFRRNQNIRPR